MLSPSLTANGTQLLYESPPYDLNNVRTVVDAILKDDGYTFDVLCVYPLNGQYGVLPRTLYYSLLAFALIFRSHKWITAGCLAAAFTYSGTAAIHAFSLSVRYDYKPYSGSVHDPTMPANELGDLDMNAIWLILSSGCIMLTPLLNWSTTIRREIKNMRAIMIWWGFLVFAGLVCAMVATYTEHHPYMVQALATCFEGDGSNPKCNAAEAQDQTLVYRPPKEFWQECNCVDTCSQVSGNAPFRTGTNLTPFISPTKAMEITGTVPFNRIVDFNQFCMIFVTVQGILGLIQCRMSQRAVRNSIFRFLSPKNREGRPLSTTSKFRPFAAKWIALITYVFAIVMAVVSPAIFIINLIIHEILLTVIPVADPEHSVGQWSSWVSLGLAVVAAVISEYHNDMVDTVRLLVNKVTSKTPHVPSPDTRSFETFGDLFREGLTQVIRPFKHAGRRTGDAWVRLRKEVSNTCDWYRDPESMSTADDLEEQHKMEDASDQAPWNTPALQPVGPHENTFLHDKDEIRVSERSL
ncbi:MAG: hypothetical protein M1833_002008 [Piccolia ochrophora]|nr:MAG: hypothetical protein M1833_002008 [Piccolia ochrophora]